MVSRPVPVCLLSTRGGRGVGQWTEEDTGSAQTMAQHCLCYSERLPPPLPQTSPTRLPAGVSHIHHIKSLKIPDQDQIVYKIIISVSNVKLRQQNVRPPHVHEDKLDLWYTSAQ